MSFTVACLKLAESFSCASDAPLPSDRRCPASSFSEVEAKVRPILAELEALRRETLRAIDLRARLDGAGRRHRRLHRRA